MSIGEAMGELPISLSIKYCRQNDRGIETAVSISFVADKVKDTIQFFVNSGHRPLFDEVTIGNNSFVSVH